jgi:hypothetical protein
VSVGGKAHKRPPRKKPPRKPAGWRVKNPVPAGPLREAFLERVESGEMSVSDIAIAAGFINAGKPDTTQLKRRLGLKPDSERHRKGRVYQSRPHDLIDSDIAGRICRALGLMPVELKDENGESIL